MWSEKGFLSLKPLSSWTIDMNERISFLQNWIKKGTPMTFWISGKISYTVLHFKIFFKGFFFPQAFITGTMQNYARKHKIAIDKLSFDFLVVDTLKHTDITSKPDDGCYIYGLYLEGARWDYRKHILS